MLSHTELFIELVSPWCAFTTVGAQRGVGQPPIPLPQTDPCCPWSTHRQGHPGSSGHVCNHGGATSEGSHSSTQIPLRSEGMASLSPTAPCGALSIPAALEPRGSPWPWSGTVARAGGSAGWLHASAAAATARLNGSTEGKPERSAR